MAGIIKQPTQFGEIISEGTFIKSDNFQYNTLGRWVDGTNDSSTKPLQDSSVMEGIICQRLPIRCLDLALVCFDFLCDGWQESSNNQHKLVRLFLKGTFIISCICI
jgi:hypothetical protein